MLFLVYFLLGFVLSLGVTPVFIWLAEKFDIYDLPTSERKIHNKAMPLTGGLAVFCAYSIALGIMLTTGMVDFARIPLHFFYAIILGGLILMFGGVLDDKYNLSAKLQWIFPILAALLVMWFGIGIGLQEISNPFGAPFSLLYPVLGMPLAYYLVFFWLMGMMFTTKLLDGLDGLASGLGAISSLSLFFLSLTPKVNQPETAVLAILFSGVLCGYLFFSFHPSKVFLGQGGSLYIGFILGILSIILGGKILTALLVMGMPILDVAWVIARRIATGKSPFVADRKHLHHRLLDLDFTHRQAVLVFYIISGIFGFSAVFFQTKGKIFLAFILFALVCAIALMSYFTYRKRGK